MTTDPAPVPAPVPKAAPRTWRRRLVRAALIYIVIPYVAILVVMTFIQRQLIYRPTTTQRLIAKSVAGAQVNADDVDIKDGNGLTLNGWHFHARTDKGSQPKFLVIYFPGNAGCRADRVADCRDFTDMGCDVVLFDYRGYGDNAGSPTEDLLAADARRVWQFATDQLHYSPDKIVIFGESLGGAVATRLAVEHSKVGPPPAALILNSAFASLGETVAWHYPAFPFQYLLLDQYPSVDRIPELACPLLHFHGTDDDIVAYAHGQRLFAAAPAKSAGGIEKRFITIPGGQHNFISMSDMGVEIGKLFAEISPPPKQEPDVPQSE